MKNLVADFSAHLSAAIEIGQNAAIAKREIEIRNVLITGLGGSGIGGTIAAQCLDQELAVPVVVCKDYFPPAFINQHTLVIVCSYSGNTEETVQAFEVALKKGAQIVCVASGGKIIDLARTNGIENIIIPGGMPPRAMFGYSFTQLFFVLNKKGLCSDKFLGEINDAIKMLQANEEATQAEAMEVAKKVMGKIAVLYSDAGYEGVCVRFRQQINENSKMLCWHHALPEMNHNELVGWVEKNENLAVIFMRNNDDYIRTQTRLDYTKEVASNVTSTIIEVWSKGESKLARTLYLVHIGDWISCYLADMKGIDAVEVNVITKLKNALAGK
nr:bifunctional phosphoglucose/phosphomannose isomerase [Bacteroidota bacterium]